MIFFGSQSGGAVFSKRACVARDVRIELRVMQRHLVGLVRVRVGFEDEHDEHDEEESETEPSPQTSSVPKIYPGAQMPYVIRIPLNNQHCTRARGAFSVAHR